MCIRDRFNGGGGGNLQWHSVGTVKFLIVCPNAICSAWQMASCDSISITILLKMFIPCAFSFSETWKNHMSIYRKIWASRGLLSPQFCDLRNWPSPCVSRKYATGHTQVWFLFNVCTWLELLQVRPVPRENFGVEIAAALQCFDSISSANNVSATGRQLALKLATATYNLRLA